MTVWLLCHLARQVKYILLYVGGSIGVHKVVVKRFCSFEIIAFMNNIRLLDI